MTQKFSPGKVTVTDEAAYALALAGQDVSFFLDKHTAGDCGDGDAERVEQDLREGSVIVGKYRTLWGHELLVATLPRRNETLVAVSPGSVVRYVPLPDLAIWREPKEDST